MCKNTHPSLTPFLPLSHQTPPSQPRWFWRLIFLLFLTGSAVRINRHQNHSTNTSAQLDSGLGGVTCLAKASVEQIRICVHACMSDFGSSQLFFVWNFPTHILFLICAVLYVVCLFVLPHNKIETSSCGSAFTVWLHSATRCHCFYWERVKLNNRTLSTHP